MIVELHCHTSEYSKCSSVKAVDLVRRAFEMDLQAIILTDHQYQWAQDELVTLRKKADVPDEFVILAAQEVSVSSFGHVLIFGAPETIEEPGLTLEEIRKRYPDIAVIWAHPYRDGRRPENAMLLSPEIQAVEIFNSNYTVLDTARAMEVWHQLKFTAVSGTDTHAESYTASYPTIFDHAFTDIPGLMQELRAGRCRPYFQEFFPGGASNVKVTELIMSPQKSDPAGKRKILKSHKNVESFEDGERSFFIMEQILASGFETELFRVPHPLEKDKNSLLTAEEGVEGKTLFSMLEKSDKDSGRHLMALTGQWLARLHNFRLQLTPRGEFIEKEPDRLDRYMHQFQNGHPHAERIMKIKEKVFQLEKELVQSQPQVLVQGHGDFHMKNVLVGRDNGEFFISAIDFNSSCQLPRAFDVGTFLAQQINMMFGRGEMALKFPAAIFLRAYIEKAQQLEPDFFDQARLFISRTCLSILFYLNKVGLGDTENFWSILVEAEKNLAQYSYSRKSYIAPTGAL